jgi:CheY-like chemotaxis protein
LGIAHPNDLHRGRAVLIVDDDEVVRLGLKIALEREGYVVTMAADGKEALDLLRLQRFDTVLSDIEMPHMTGLELLREAKSVAPEVPFVMITARANMNYTIEALRLGAVNFVRKPFSTNEIVQVVMKAVWLAVDESLRREILGFLCESKSLAVPSRLRYVKGLVYFLAQNLPPSVAHDPTETHKIQLALDEAITNAHEHGNMEFKGSDRNLDDYPGRLMAREEEAPFRDRMIRVASEVTPEQVRYTVRDEGAGFDHGNLPDPNDADGLFELHDRSILLIRLSMDEVTFSPKGNEITMIKRSPAATEA